MNAFHHGHKKQLYSKLQLQFTHSMASGGITFFYGKISQEWLKIYNKTRPHSDRTPRYSTHYIWVDNIFEMRLKK